jgi:hypothetical protein
MEMTMKNLITLLCLMSMTPAFATDPAHTAAASTTTASAAPAKPVMHRYLIERTFPAGALKGLDAATKAKVNTSNKSVGVRWIKSFANADETKTFCLYEAPSEAAVRKAAELNKLPVDSIMEVPVTLLPR